MESLASEKSIVFKLKNREVKIKYRSFNTQTRTKTIRENTMGNLSRKKKYPWQNSRKNRNKKKSRK